jgi:dephospho-CoA kinase
MLLVGLTGGVASGKTTVSRILEKEGATVIAADQIAKELVKPGRPAAQELARVFGRGILREDGTLDRKKLANRVFSDPKQRNLLEKILHPRIKKEIERRIQKVTQRDPEAIVIIDAALLIEVGAHREMDEVIVVTSKAEKQIKRLEDRDGLAPEEARRILASQMPQEEKLKAADFVIPNDGALEETIKRTKEIFQELKERALLRAKKFNPILERRRT